MIILTNWLLLLMKLKYDALSVCLSVCLSVSFFLSLFFLLFFLCGQRREEYCFNACYCISTILLQLMNISYTYPYLSLTKVLSQIKFSSALFILKYIEIQQDSHHIFTNGCTLMLDTWSLERIPSDLVKRIDFGSTVHQWSTETPGLSFALL